MNEEVIDSERSGRETAAAEGRGEGRRYGLPAREVMAAQRFFAVLRATGRIRLACGAVGWTRAKVEDWRQMWKQDGTVNRRYRPVFARAVEQTICEFQIGLIAQLSETGEEVAPGRWRAPAWMLERFFGSEYARKAGERAGGAGRK